MDKNSTDFIPREEAEPNALKERRKRPFKMVAVSFAIASLISLFLFFVLEVSPVFCLIPILVVGAFFSFYYSDDTPVLW
ncbi:MAG: hypothetical protein FWC38_05925 [Proteobacteria bacterium]|nr:hypothetical protein [Pseudomonadota bacterium]MCL2307748.1 hypothetical protein [Pseudomonadota bacterium]